MRLAAEQIVSEGSAGGRYEALTSIRGIAAWWIVVYHFRVALIAVVPGIVMAVLNRGYLAVDMFFVLSGFVISLNYRRWFADGVRERWARFVGLRLVRIYPLHLFILVAYLVDPLAVFLWSTRRDLGQFSVRDYVESLFLVQAWGMSPKLTWNVPAWSISAEWFVYLVFPMMAFGSTRAIRGPWTAFVWTASSLAALFLGPALFGVSFVTDIGRLAVIRCILEFSAGFGIMHLRTMLDDQHRLSIVALAFGTLVLTLVIAQVLPDEAAAAAFAALIFALSDSRLAVARWMGSGSRVGRVLLALGAVSYSTYLCHFLIRSWVRFVFIGHGLNPVPAFGLYIALTALASPLLYLLVERPGRHWGRALLGVQARAAVATGP